MAIVVIFSTFITLHNYSTILLPIFIIWYVKSLGFAYDSLQVCTLKQHQSYPLPCAPGNHGFCFLLTGLFKIPHLSDVILDLSFSV